MKRTEKVIKKKPKKATKATQKPAERSSGRTAQIRVSHENKAILEAIEDRLEEMYDKEMVDLSIKSLTIDGALTQVLTTALIEWSLPETMLEADSTYIRVRKAADSNDNKKEA